MNAPVLACLGFTLALAATLPAQDNPQRTHEFTASLDDVLDWSAPLDLTEEKLASTWKKDGFSNSPLYATSDTPGPDGKTTRRLRFGAQPYNNITVTLSALTPDLLITEGHLTLPEDPALTQLELEFAPKSPVAPALTARWKDHPSKTLDVQTETAGQVTFTTWTLDRATAVLIESRVAPPTLRIARPDHAAALAILFLERNLILNADLDFLLRGPATWTLTAADLDRRFTVPQTNDPLYFQWLDSDHKRARFTRKPYSNVTAALSLLNGQVPIQEANLDFENGRLTRATLSLFNRGDSDPLTVPEFEKLIQNTGRSLGQLLATTPKPQTSAPGAPIKTSGWLWTSPDTVALMEHNDINARAAKGASNQPEYLRLKLAPAQNRDWSLGAKTLGATSSIVTKASLLKNLRQTPEGATYIAGIPMVDQGDKGYCVVASCQRLFEFYQVPCDQHELAQLVGTTADGGTNSRLMEAGLNKIDSTYKTRFKALISPGMDRRDRERLDTARFAKMIQTSIDEGIPLLWTLQLGRAEEIPPLSTTGQVTGGHMRLIIGYDPKTSQVLFTDSWGAGHELKRMSLAGAYTSTDGLYTLTPRSY
jgi:hypothetical protein